MGETKRRFNQEHYDLIKRCSDEKNMTEWNKFAEKLRKNSEPAWLEGADFSKAYLEEADLREAHLEYAKFIKANLKGANLREARLEEARFNGSHLIKTDLREAHLGKAHFIFAHLNEADFRKAHLEEAYFDSAILEEAKLWKAHLELADLRKTKLKGADLTSVRLEGANFTRAHLEGANFKNSICNGETLITDCYIGWYTDKEEKNRLTDFRGVGLNNIQLSPGLKQLIEYNNRQLSWNDWYKTQKGLHMLKVPFFRFLWWLSDYGHSSGRILGAFFGFSFLFACLYVIDPTLIKGIQPETESLFLHDWQLYLRAFYFSIVTMTTLGFGDISANPANPWGHMALIVQVILGYVILGALVTRLSILFNADGPSAQLSKKKYHGTKSCGIRSGVARIKNRRYQLVK